VPALKTAYARAQAAGVPLVAIGGITRERAPSLVTAADAIAVIADLLPPTRDAGASPPAGQVLQQVLQEVAARARALGDVFRQGPTRVLAAL
jgi:thiamine monophosphate synthase